MTRARAAHYPSFSPHLRPPIGSSNLDHRAFHELTHSKSSGSRPNALQLRIIPRATLQAITHSSLGIICLDMSG